MFTLSYLHKITITDIPLQWMTRIELFSSDLEQFPLMYIHLLTDKANVPTIGNYNPQTKQRIFGFVLAAKWGELKDNGLCDVEIQFACNIPKEHNLNYDALILDELSHRIGIADKVSFDDLTHICTNSPNSLPLLQKIWLDKIEIVYGKYIPHGRIFDEMYGIIRFSASGNAPKLGKTSEYRMLYWYMADLGEKVIFDGEVSHLEFLEFYVLPTYEELTQESFTNFEKFLSFYTPTKRFWELEYTGLFSVNGHNFKYGPATTLPVKGEIFERRYTRILGNDYDKISRLRQIFNRMPSRLYGYIWNLMTPVTTDFRNAFRLRNNFKEFYRDYSTKKGSSTKVVACFLQQAFGIEAFPIDTWVKTFIYYPLGMSPKDNGKGEPSATLQNNLYSSYNHLDKLEKLIWASSMGNKTNKTEFLDILWCQRYGTIKAGKGPCRGANPLSCSQCILRKECLAYQSISNENIYISDNKKLLEIQMRAADLFFGVYTDNGTPRQIYVLQGNDFTERDTHSGLNVPIATTVANGQTTVDAFIRSL